MLSVKTHKTKIAILNHLFYRQIHIIYHAKSNRIIRTNYKRSLFSNDLESFMYEIISLVTSRIKI